MNRYRNPGNSRRANRGLVDHDEMEGLPIKPWRRTQILVGAPPPTQPKTSRLFQSELMMPKDSHLLCPMSQALLQAARAGRVNSISKHPAEEEEEVKEPEEEEGAGKKTTVAIEKTGFMATKWQTVPGHLEKPEPEYLAKRRKGLPPLTRNSVSGTRGQRGLMRRVRVRRVNAEGVPYVEEVLAAEGQRIDGDVLTEEVMTAEGAPGTVVHGVGVVNAEGLVVASQRAVPTTPRRRAPPPRRKAKPKGRRKKVVFAPGVDGTRVVIGTNGVTLPSIEGVKAADGGNPPMSGAAEQRVGQESKEDSVMIDDDDEEDDGDDGEDGDEDDREDGELSPSPEPEVQVLPSKRSITDMAASSFTTHLDSAGQYPDPESPSKRIRMTRSRSPDHRPSDHTDGSVARSLPPKHIVATKPPPIDHLKQPLVQPKAQSPLSAPATVMDIPTFHPPTASTSLAAIQNSPPEPTFSSFNRPFTGLPPRSSFLTAHHSLPPRPPSFPQAQASSLKGGDGLELPMFKPPTAPAPTPTPAAEVPVALQINASPAIKVMSQTVSNERPDPIVKEPVPTTLTELERKFEDPTTELEQTPATIPMALPAPTPAEVETSERPLSKVSIPDKIEASGHTVASEDATAEAIGESLASSRPIGEIVTATPIVTLVSHDPPVEPTESTDSLSISTNIDVHPSVEAKIEIHDAFASTPSPQAKFDPAAQPDTHESKAQPEKAESGDDFFRGLDKHLEKQSTPSPAADPLPQASNESLPGDDIVNEAVLVKDKA